MDTSLRQEGARLAPYAGLVALSVGLVWLRVERTGSIVYVFLIWNLILASVPLALTTALRLAGAARPLAAVPVLALWLLFLPNAPYLLTDLIHLGPKPPVPLWYDLGVLLAAAGTGLALGYRSLLDAEAIVARWVGRAASGVLSVAVLFLCGFGIYLGRFLRLNSWEALSDPAGVLLTIVSRVADPLAHPRTWGVTLVFGTLLTLGYLALRTPAAPPLSGDRT